MKILFCGEMFPAAPILLKQRLPPNDQVQVCPASRLRESLQGVYVLIPLMSRINAEIMDAGNFRVIQQWGSGLEGVDFEAARARAIAVANIPTSGSNADSVAEHVILLTLALMRLLPLAQQNIRLGLLGTPMGRMLGGRTVCLYGLGSIARSLAARLRAFDVRLIGITRAPGLAKKIEFGLDECYSATDRLVALAQTDVLIVCLRSSPQAKGIIDEEALNALPAGAILVNAARGLLVDYHALYSALSTGHLAGAGLDVYWQEPISSDDPLLALPNVIATPHVAGCTDRSYGEIADAVALNIERLRRGEPLAYRVV